MDELGKNNIGKVGHRPPTLERRWRQKEGDLEKKALRRHALVVNFFGNV